MTSSNKFDLYRAFSRCLDSWNRGRNRKAPKLSVEATNQVVIQLNAFL
ncbi:hypothetical protein N9P58_00780 [Puniceicoccaceae bacterium]|nr:hypothetical protein [Puniceicoccaceae bacterium]